MSLGELVNIRVQGVEQMLLDLRMNRTEIGLANMHARDGLVANISQVSAEFIQQNNLKPLKIVITGPPCSGKSALADHLGHQYSLPVIRASDLLDSVDKLQPLDNAAIEQALKGGKKGSGRVPPDMMAKLGRLVLSGVPAKNTGFILDGYPKTLREARELFTDPREWTQAELDENAAVEAALASKAPNAVGTKGGKAEKSEAKLGVAASNKIDDVPDPRKVCDVFMPNALVPPFSPCCCSIAEIDDT